MVRFVPSPAVGIGYRAALDAWTHEYLDRFDVFEINVDHYIGASPSTASRIFDLVDRISLTAHGIGQSARQPVANRHSIFQVNPDHASFGSTG
jgi:hypothetical protein